MDELEVVVHNRSDHSKQSLSIPFTAHDTVRSVECKISTKLGVPREQLRIVMCGHALEETTNVKDLLLGPATSLVVLVEKNLSPCLDLRTVKSSVAGEAAVNRSTPEIGSFYVWCKSCNDLQRAKLRVYCSQCTSPAVLVKREPSCWRDVQLSRSIEVLCADCNENSYAVFIFKCISCNETGAVLNQVRGNFEGAECSICLDEHCTYLFDIGCHHMVCRQCFVECLSVALKENRLVFRPPHGYTISCPYPGCERYVTDVHHFRVLGNEMYEFYQRTAAEKLVELDDQGVFCPYPDCGSSFFWETEDSDGKTSCPDCLRLFCRLCKSTECVCGLDDPTTITIQATTKKCPGCGANTERNGGCTHIHCVKCGMNWCFVCVTPWTDDCQWNHWFD